MSASTELITEYLRTRYSSPIFVLLAVLLALAGAVGAGGMNAALSDAMIGVPIAYLLVLAFRVWDDLEDLPRDRAEHPERVTVRARTLLPIAALGLASSAAALALVCFRSGDGRSLLALGAAAVVLLVWYRVSRGRDFNRLLGAHVVLLKYPAIAYAAAPAASSLIGIVAIYLALCVYESRDDPHLRASRPARAVAVVEMALLVPLAAYAVHAALSASRLTALAGA